MKEQELRKVHDRLVESPANVLKKQQIEALESSSERRKLMAELNCEINKEARVLTAVMFGAMDVIEFEKFLSDGGTIVELRQRIHI